MWWILNIRKLETQAISHNQTAQLWKITNNVRGIAARKWAVD